MDERVGPGQRQGAVIHTVMHEMQSELNTLCGPAPRVLSRQSCARRVRSGRGRPGHGAQAHTHTGTRTRTRCRVEFYSHVNIFVCKTGHTIVQSADVVQSYTPLGLPHVF